MTDTATPNETFQPEIERAIQILKQGGCTEVYLFGSLAEGRASEQSDIDLAVRGCPRDRFFKLLGRLLFELKHSVDLVDLDSPDPFSQYLSQTGALRRVG